jgi:hypothetical protein
MDARTYQVRMTRLHNGLPEEDRPTSAREIVLIDRGQQVVATPGDARADCAHRRTPLERPAEPIEERIERSAATAKRPAL